jgi:hypothetical protein
MGRLFQRKSTVTGADYNRLSAALFQNVNNVLTGAESGNARRRCFRQKRAVVLSGNSAENDDGFRRRGLERKPERGKKVTKEVVGIRVLLIRSLFVSDIPRR